MKNKYLINFFAFLTLLISCKQEKKQILNNKVDYEERCRIIVLEENIPNQEFEFSISGKEINQKSLTYLGNIITNKSDTLKILNQKNYFGLYEDSKRGNGSVYIYDTKNNQIGFYYLGSAFSVPNKIENKKDLVFDYKNEICNETTKISLKDSIPKKIFVKCSSKGGDLYNFKNNQ